jgi:short-subunit dehydrogenase
LPVTKRYISAIFTKSVYSELSEETVYATAAAAASTATTATAANPKKRRYAKIHRVSSLQKIERKYIFQFKQMTSNQIWEAQCLQRLRQRHHF